MLLVFLQEADRLLKSVGRLLQDVASQSLTLPRLNTLQSSSPPKIKYDDDDDTEGTNNQVRYS